MPHRRNYLKCILGLDRADCFRSSCKYFDRGQGCQYKAPEPVKPLGLQRRARPPAYKPARPMPEPEKAAAGAYRPILRPLKLPQDAPGGPRTNAAGGDRV